MTNRTFPYNAFNFIVKWDNNINPESILGGFSDVSGINTELILSEYRNGNEPESHVRKVPGLHKVGDVTLKRGIVNSKDLWTWIAEVRGNGPSAKREVVISLRDEAGQTVQSWKLRGVVPMKYTGPTLTGKGGTDVAMEELVLSAEGLVFVDAGGNEVG